MNRPEGDAIQVAESHVLPVACSPLVSVCSAKAAKREKSLSPSGPHTRPTRRGDGVWAQPEPEDPDWDARCGMDAIQPAHRAPARYDRLEPKPGDGWGLDATIGETRLAPLRSDRGLAGPPNPTLRRLPCGRPRCPFRSRSSTVLFGSARPARNKHGPPGPMEWCETRDHRDRRGGHRTSGITYGRP